LEIKINNKKIGKNNPCYTIAEAGANHDSSLEKAFKLIDAAKEAKADSIKFQTYKADKLATKTAPKYWDDDKPNESQFDVFNKLDAITKDQWREIFEYAQKKEITCFSTPFDEESVDLLYDLQAPAFKIASADITHIPLIKHVAAKNLPIFISTGMASDDEIDEALGIIEDQGNHQIVLMHCMTSYPTKPEDANLEMIRTLSEKYSKYIIGYSDHTLGINVPICSILYGAKVIEKHFTFDNNLEGSPDHWLSLDTKAFGNMVEGIRQAEVSGGQKKRDSFEAEVEAVKYARRSIVSSTKIEKGTVITKDMLDIKRPATGIYPKFFEKVIGSVASNDIEEDMPIKWEDLEIYEK
jgi:sialic acid synthase SpsE